MIEKLGTKIFICVSVENIQFGQVQKTFSLKNQCNKARGEANEILLHFLKVFKVLKEAGRDFK